MRQAWVGLVLIVAGAAGCTPHVPAERVTFATLAGVYYDATGGASVEAALAEDADVLLSRAVTRINTVDEPDFVLLAGDLLARSDPLSLDRLKARLDDLAVPYYVVLGDHDGPVAPGKGETVSRSTIIWAFQGHGFQGAREYWAAEVRPGLLLVGLDTAVPGRAAGHVGVRQLAWLDRMLAAHPAKAVIVAAHHGLVPLHPLDEGQVWRNLMVDNADAVRAVLQRHPNVVLVVTGHHHFAEGRVEGHVVHLAAPSVSVWPLAYALVRLGRTEAEALWVPLDESDLRRRAQERLLASSTLRGPFPAGEDGDTACVRLFGGKKLEKYRLPTIRPD